jgi:hypothetical protein
MAYEAKLKFQVSWAAKLPWAKLQLGFTSGVHVVKCKTFLEVEHKNKLIAPKWNSLNKNMFIGGNLTNL